jgi:hypothetical protein
MSESELVVSPAFEPCRYIFQRLLSQAVTRVSIEPWSVWLLFYEGELHIEGEWRLRGPDGAIVDQTYEFEERQRFDLWRIAGQKILGFEFSDEPLPRFVMQLTNGWSLEVVADNDGMDDWSLTSQKFKVFCNGTSITVFS